MNSAFFKIQKLSDSQLLELENEFENIVGVPEESEQLFKKLDELLRVLTPKDQFAARRGYLRWYTELFWRKIQNSTPEELVEIGFGRLLPMAILLDFDVIQSVIVYLRLRTDYIDQMESLYSKIRLALFTSEAVVGDIQGKSIAVRDLVEESRLIDSHSPDSLERANFFLKIQNTIYPKNDEYFESILSLDAEAVANKYIDTINFFLGVETENIWYMVDAFMNPDLYEDNSKKSEDAFGNKKDFSEDATNSTEILELNSIENSSVKYTQIKQDIDSHFTKNSDGQFLDPGAVFKTLENLALEYNDEKINDLYYFDESSAEFRWNDDLIQSQS